MDCKIVAEAWNEHAAVWNTAMASDPKLAQPASAADPGCQPVFGEKSSPSALGALGQAVQLLAQVVTRCHAYILVSLLLLYGRIHPAQGSCLAQHFLQPSF
jgi:hypothetical protein